MYLKNSIEVKCKALKHWTDRNKKGVCVYTHTLYNWN